MAKETFTRLIDDISGKPIEDGKGESITFSFNGQEYEIDLETKAADKFRETIKFYTDHATAVKTTSSRRSSGSRSSSKRDPEELKAIREWARKQGNDISDRGRIPSEIEDAYRAANK